MIPVKVMDAVEYFEDYGLWSGRLGKEDEHYVKVLIEYIRKVRDNQESYEKQ